LAAVQHCLNLLKARAGVGVISGGGSQTDYCPGTVRALASHAAAGQYQSSVPKKNRKILTT